MHPRVLSTGAAALCAGILCVAAVKAPPPGQPQRVWALSPMYQMTDVSPDGKLAVYVDWTTDGNLMVRDLATGATRDLTKKTLKKDEAEPAAQFSPDSKRIYYDWTNSTDNTDQIRMVGIDGSDMKTLYRAQMPGTGLWPAMWTADGASILMWISRFDSTHKKKSSGSALLPAAGGTPRPIPGGGSADAISLDGRFFAGTVRGNDHDIVITSATDGKEVSRVTNPSNVRAIRFTADGFVFTSERGGSPGLWKQTLSSGRPQGDAHLVRGDLWRLHAGDPGIWFDAVGRLYYEVNAGDRDVYLVNFDPETGRTRSQPLPLSKAPGEDYFGPQFSPDGKYVAMTKREQGHDGPPKIVIRSLMGDEVREFPIAGTNRQAYGVLWIPGSQALAVSVFDSTFHSHVVRLDLASGEKRVLASNGPSSIAFSPDGRTLYYAPSGVGNTVAGQIMARDLASGGEHPAYSAPRGEVAHASAVSRDGKIMIVALARSLHEHPYRILAVTIATGAVHNLSAAVPAADSGNGGQRALGFTADQSAELLLAPKLGDAAHTLTLWRVPLNGGTAAELGPAPKALEFNERQPSGPWLSPDATRLVYVGGDLKTELWKIDDPAIRAELAVHPAAP